MMSLVTPTPIDHLSDAQEVIDLVYAVSRAARVTPLMAYEQKAHDRVETFLLARSHAPQAVLAQAAHLLDSALRTPRPPSHGNTLLTRSVNACLVSRVLAFARVGSAVIAHWGAWGSMAGVVTALGGQPVVEQSLLTVRLSQELPLRDVGAFACWLAHPVLLKVLNRMTTPIEFFLKQLNNASCFLSDEALQQELFKHDRVAPCCQMSSSALNLSQGQSLSRAYGLDKHLALPDLAEYNRAQVEAFLLASGLCFCFEDIVCQSWPQDAPKRAVRAAVNMLSYALTPWIFECLHSQGPAAITAFYSDVASYPIAQWTKLLADITHAIKDLRQRLSDAKPTLLGVASPSREATL